MKPLTKSTIILTHIFLAVVSAIACTKTQPASPAEVSAKFVTSLNHKDMDTLVGLSTMPLWVRQQDWESAKDGAGFILGKANDINLADPESIKKYFSDPLKKISVESEKPDTASLLLLQDELKGSEQLWRGLSIQLFRRGMGDVEHIFVLGVDGKGKVAAVYLN